MKSGTSFFNRGVLVKSVLRFWPIWAVYAFVQLLGDHHGLFRREAQLPGRLLLQGGGGEGRGGIALLLRFFDVGNVEFLPVDVADHGKGISLVFQLPLLSSPQ